MEYALIKQSLVENVIVADEAFISLIQSQWDHCVLIDDLSPKPGIDWRYENGEFINPWQPSEPPQE